MSRYFQRSKRNLFSFRLFTKTLAIGLSLTFAHSMMAPAFAQSGSPALTQTPDTGLVLPINPKTGKATTETTAKRDTPHKASSQTDPYRIFMVVWRGCENACQGFQDYFRNNRIPITMTIRNAERDKTRLPDFVNEIKQQKPDLVVTWGTSVTLGILGTYDSKTPENHIGNEIPSVFMIVSQPVDAKVIPDFASSGRNITGTSYLVPEATQLRAARSYLNYDKLAVIYNPKEKNSMVNVGRLRDLAKTESFTLIEAPILLDSQGNPRPESIPNRVQLVKDQGADLLYQGPDSFLNVNRDRLTGAALDIGLPVFAAGENPVRTSQALMGVINRYYTVGQLTAHKAKQILVDHVAAESIPIEAPKRFSYMINMKAALKLKLFPPMSLLKFAEVIED